MMERPRNDQQFFVFVQEIVGDANVLVRESIRIHRRNLVVFARVLQIVAVERTVHRHLTLGAAAKRANLAANSGAETLRPPDFANRAYHIFPV